MLVVVIVCSKISLFFYRLVRQIQFNCFCWISMRPKENIALFPAHRPGENFSWCHPAANKMFFNLFSIMKFRYTCISIFRDLSRMFHVKSRRTLVIGNVLFQLIVTQNNKIPNFRRNLSQHILKIYIFAAARMRFIFVTRCAGNK